jgi:anaerobic selenocysteine-containing dehydrogenase
MIETYGSFCRFCHAVCGIEVDVEHGRVDGTMRVIPPRPYLIAEPSAARR